MSNGPSKNEVLGIPESYVGHFVTPAALIVTGMMYLSGQSSRETEFGHFGLSGSMLEETIQSTLARGYPPLIVVTVCVVMLIFIATTTKMAYFPRTTGLVRRISAFFLGMIMPGLLLIGLISGQLYGAIRIGRAEAAISGHCLENCQVFYTAKEHHIGYLLGQDTKLLVILTQRGIRIVKLDELIAVKPPRIVPIKSQPIKVGVK